MKWVRFANRAAFIAWHDARCTEHSIPRPGASAVNPDEVRRDAQWTVAYVRPWRHLGTIVALVPDDDAVGLLPAVITPETRVDSLAVLSDPGFVFEKVAGD